MDDMNKELNNYEPEAGITLPELTDEPSVDAEPVITGEVPAENELVPAGGPPVDEEPVNIADGTVVNDPVTDTEQPTEAVIDAVHELPGEQESVITDSASQEYDKRPVFEEEKALQMAGYSETPEGGVSADENSGSNSYEDVIIEEEFTDSGTIDAERYNWAGMSDQVKYGQPGASGRNVFDQSGTPGQGNYNQSGTAGQGNYNQPGTPGQGNYSQSGTAGQGNYNQSGAAGQSSYNQSGISGQGNYTQPGPYGQSSGYGQPNNYGPANYHQGGNYGQSSYVQGRPNNYGPGNYAQNGNYSQGANAGPGGSYNRGANTGQGGSYGQGGNAGQNNNYSQGGNYGQRSSSGQSTGYNANNNRGNYSANGSKNETQNRFTNDGYGKGRTGYSSSYDSYRFETPVDPAPINPSDTQYKKKKKKEADKNKSDGKMTAKRIGAFAGIAALFGLVAALVFLGITSIAGKKVTDNTPENGSGIKAIPTPTIILEEPESDSTPPNTGTSDTSVEVAELTVPQVVEQCMPSMVAITNTTIEEYRDFFGGTSQQESVSAGSGIIVGETETELLIATNNHVIQNSSDITVTFIDEAAITGSVKGMDADNDLAIVAVKLDDIKQETKDAIRIITIGNSDDMVVGESVVAIGNALGYGQSVSAGIISALGREVDIDGQTHKLIQTDASINPGNSGGALINMRGELIGINEVKFVDETVEGVGYAIPMATAEPILSSLGSKAARQKVDDSQASYIGIKCIDVPSYYVQAGYPAGVYVSEVTKGGPAEEAGLKEGDIITAIDGISVTSSSQLINYLQYYAAGETIDFSVSRLNEDNTAFESSKMPITLGNRNDADLTEDSDDSDDDESSEPEESQEEEPSEDADENNEQPEGGFGEFPGDNAGDGGFPFLPDVENR